MLIEPASSATSRLFSPRIALGIAWLLSLYALLFLHGNASWFVDSHFWSLLILDDQEALIALLLLLPFIGLALPRLPHILTRLPDHVSRYRIPVTTVAVAALALLSRYIYQGQPLSMDEYAPWFQAHAFAAGDIGGRFPPQLIDYLLSPVFRNDFFVIDQNNGLALSNYWPGFALLLTPFTWLGMPWLCNPVLVGGTLLCGWHLGRDLLGSERAGGWVMLLMLGNPAIMLNGIALYSMPAHLLCNTLFIWLLLKPVPWRYLCAGLIGGLALSLHNPFPHLVFILPLLPWLLRNAGLKQLALLALGYAVSGIPLVFGWILIKAPVAAATLLVDRATGLPSLTPSSSLPPVTLLSTISGTLAGLFTWPSDYLLLARNGALIKLWVWSSPLMICLALYGAFLARSSMLRYLAASALFTLLAYYLIRFDQGLGWGYRYFHPSYLALPLLASVAIIHLENNGPNRLQWSVLAPTLALTGLLALMPLHTTQMAQRVAAARTQMPPHVEGRGLYVFNGTGYCQGLRCDLLQNDPFLRGDIYVINNQRRSKISEKDLLLNFPGASLHSENAYGRSYRLPD